MRITRLIIVLAILLIAAGLWAQLGSAKQTESKSWFSWGPISLTLFGAGIAAVLAGIGSSIGIGISGGMSMGAMQERPELFGRFLPLAAMAGTQGIYGIVIAVVIMGKITPGMSLETGWQLFFSGLPIGFAGLVSAIWQGKVCAGGIGLVTKDPSQFGKALVMGVLVEFYALLGLLASILMTARIA